MSGPDDPPVRRVDLVRLDLDDGHVRLWIAEAADGSIAVERFDFGELTDRMLGGDYEHGVRFHPGNHAELAFDRLAADLAGRQDAVHEAKRRCEAAGVAVSEQRWN